MLISSSQGVASYELESPTYWTDGTPLPRLTVVSRNGSYDSTFGWYRVNGQVRNDEPTMVKYVKPAISLYDGAGRIVGCGFTYVNSTDLAPGQTSSFSTSVSGRDFQNVTSFSIQVDGDKQ